MPIIETFLGNSKKSSSFAKVDPPTKMPASQIQRIKDLKCPPPIVPSKVSAKINALNAAMLEQATQIEILAKLVDDLESRYKISFTSDNNPKFNLTYGDTPTISLNGNLTNLILEFNLWQANAGIKGIPGEQGDQGKHWFSTAQGPAGTRGYYGIRGDMK